MSTQSRRWHQVTRNIDVSCFAEGQQVRWDEARHHTLAIDIGHKNLSTRSRSPASLGSIGSQSQRDIGVTVIPQPLLIGSHDGRLSVEGDVQLTSWNDPSVRFTNNAHLGL